MTTVMEACSSATRGCVIAPKGKKLVVADLSNIEGRKLAWLASEEWKLQAFRDFDTVIGWDDKRQKPIRKGPDLYNLAYAKAFGMHVEDVQDTQRQIGKTMELACLGGDTLVLTRQKGYIAIRDVTTDVQLWDGEEWAQHQGLLVRGVRTVVNVSGIQVTPDHLIKTGTTWKQAGLLAINESILCQALETGSKNLPWSDTTSVQRGVRQRSSTSSVPAGLPRTRYMTTTYGMVSRLAATLARRLRRATGGKTFGHTPTSFHLTTIGGACSTEFQPASTGATIQKTPTSRTMAHEAFKSSSPGELIGGLSSPTSSPSKTGIKRHTRSIVKTLIGATSRVISGLSRELQTRAIVGKSALCKPRSCDSNPKIETYDIAFSGPRNCFTVLSDRGPLIAHNCGYAGGVGAFITFSLAFNIDLELMAKNAWDAIPEAMRREARDFMEWHISQGKSTYGLSEEAFIVCESFKRLWREAHPQTVSYWKELENACREAINNPGRTLTRRRHKIRRDGAWLRVMLPSGRYLCYPSPRVEDDGQITYMGINQYSRKWERLRTYSGKLAENVTQASARDVLAYRMPDIEKAGYEIVLTVHDEIISEAPDTDEYTHEHLAELMSAGCDWTEGLPLAAAGFEAYRYRKG